MALWDFLVFFFFFFFWGGVQWVREFTLRVEGALGLGLRFWDVWFREGFYVLFFFCCFGDSGLGV